MVQSVVGQQENLVRTGCVFSISRYGTMTSTGGRALSLGIHVPLMQMVQKGGQGSLANSGCDNEPLFCGAAAF